MRVEHLLSVSPSCRFLLDYFSSMYDVILLFLRGRVTLMSSEKVVFLIPMQLDLTLIFTEPVLMLPSSLSEVPRFALDLDLSEGESRIR